MNIIAVCPECGSEVDEHAAVCPFCGYYIDQLSKPRSARTPKDRKPLYKRLNASLVASWLITIAIMTLWAYSAIGPIIMDSNLGPGGAGSYAPGTKISRIIHMIPGIPMIFLFFMAGPPGLLVFSLLVLLVIYTIDSWQDNPKKHNYYSRNILLASIGWGAFELVSNFKHSQLITQPIVWTPLKLVVLALEKIQGSFLCRELYMSLKT